ncbi:MAG: hypothetical protein V3T31_11635, partial [candidate division Zixibacteria bacterium]
EVLADYNKFIIGLGRESASQSGKGATGIIAVDADSLHTIQLTAWAIAGMFGILAAWFHLHDAFQTDGDRVQSRRSYSSKWHRIQRSGILSLPHIAIKSVHGVIRQLSTRGAKLVDEMAYWTITRLITAMAPFLAFPIFYLEFGTIWAIVLTVPLLPTSLMLSWLMLAATFSMIEQDRTAGRVVTALLRYVNGEYLSFKAFMAVTGLGWLLANGVALNMILSLSLFASAGLIVAIVPVMAILMTIPWMLLFSAPQDVVAKLDKLSDSFVSQNAPILGMSAALSFGVTMLSIIIGHLASPETPAPQTLQMLLVNVGCDGLTMLITFGLLGLAVRDQKPWPVPVVVILDLAIAAILACASLYLGLLGSELALTIPQTLRVLFGLAPAGAGYELGPYFWVMHTTFLPTAVYLALIALCWIGKLIVLPLSMILGKARVIEKPHILSAVACTLMAVVFGVLATGLGHWENEIRKDVEVVSIVSCQTALQAILPPPLKIYTQPHQIPPSHSIVSD